MYVRSRRAKILPGVSFVRRTGRFTFAQLPPCATLHAMQIAFAMRLDVVTFIYAKAYHSYVEMRFLR